MRAISTYRPPGPVAAAFLSSRKRIRAIMGPLGSGKTGACLLAFVYQAMAQAPHPVDRVRRTKFAVIRDTYRNLENTTIPSWQRWLPKNYPGSHWIGGSGGVPAKHTLKFDLADGTTVEMTVEFIGLGENAAEAVMPGWEGTGAYLNEADKLSRETLNYVNGRLGRYPEVDADVGFAGATEKRLILDFNAPDIDHWLYDFCVEQPPDNLDFFVQPGALVMQGGRYALNPRAENLRNLADGYYLEQISGQPRWYIQRMILNQWGASRDGQPVYEDYDDTIHTAPYELEPVAGLPLVIGADAGLTPALVIGQQMPNGQWRIYDELVAPPSGMGAIKFGEALNKLLRERYPAWAPQPAGMGHNGGPALDDEDEGPRILCYADPAANARASTDERTWIAVFAATTGIPTRPGPTNALTARLEAVRMPLTRLIDHSPALWISPRCKKLRRGFNSGYRLRRIAGASNRFADEPEKNEWSHVHDALQYLLTGQGGHLQAMGLTARRGQRRQTRAMDDEHPGAWEGGRQTMAVEE